MNNAESPSTSTRPLAGIRIVDLSSFFSGPMATRKRAEFSPSLCARPMSRVRLARAAALFDGVALEPGAPAPHLGEHGRAVLGELGFDDAQVARWIASGVLRLPAGGRAAQFRA